MYIKILISINQVNTLRPFKNTFSQSFSQLVKEDVYFLSIIFSTITGSSASEVGYPKQAAWAHMFGLDVLWQNTF